MNWTPGDYFYHRVHGYQKVSQVSGDALWFWGQPYKLVIKDGKTNRILDPHQSHTSVKVSISEAVAVSEDDARRAILAEHAASNPTIPDIDAGPMPADIRAKRDELMARLNAKLTAKTAPPPTEATEPPDLEYFKKIDFAKPTPSEPAATEPAKKKLPTPYHVKQDRTAERFDKLRDAMLWLERAGLPAIPVAPVWEGNFNGKCPSWQDQKGNPHQIKWKRFTQGATPSAGEKAEWWGNLANGIGTFAGLNNIYWVDIDRKHFDNDADCEDAAKKLWGKAGGTGLLEKTQSGGWRFPFKYFGHPFKTFTFSREEGGDPIGEILGFLTLGESPVNNFVVLGPSYGQLGSYETVQRSLDIPIIDSITDFFGIAKKYKRTHSETYNNPDFVRFPAKLYSYFGRPMALWLLARAKDKDGSGRAILALDEICTLTGRSVSSIRRWTNKGIKKGLFSARGFTTPEGQGFIEIFYASKERACFLAGAELGTVGLINIKEDLESLHVAATDILALGLQRQSRHAQYKEQVKKISQKLKVPEAIGKKKAVKTIRPERLASGQPCENDMARVLLAKERFLLASEGLAAYGASLGSTAKERGLSVRQTNRHLAKSYRETPSPVRGFREGIKPIVKRQIIQRMPSAEMNDRQFEYLLFEASGGNEVSPSKFFKGKDGRYWERKPCVMAPTFRLVSCRFRLTRLVKIQSVALSAA